MGSAVPYRPQGASLQIINDESQRFEMQTRQICTTQLAHGASRSPTSDVYEGPLSDARGRPQISRQDSSGVVANPSNSFAKPIAHVSTKGIAGPTNFENDDTDPMLPGPEYGGIALRVYVGGVRRNETIAVLDTGARATDLNLIALRYLKELQTQGYQIDPQAVEGSVTVPGGHTLPLKSAVQLKFELIPYNEKSGKYERQLPQTDVFHVLDDETFGDVLLGRDFIQNSKAARSTLAWMEKTKRKKTTRNLLHALIMQHQMLKDIANAAAAEATRRLREQDAREVEHRNNQAQNNQQSGQTDVQAPHSSHPATGNLQTTNPSERAPHPGPASSYWT